MEDDEEFEDEFEDEFDEDAKKLADFEKLFDDWDDARENWNKRADKFLDDAWEESNLIWFKFYPECEPFQYKYADGLKVELLEKWITILEQVEHMLHNPKAKVREYPTGQIRKEPTIDEKREDTERFVLSLPEEHRKRVREEEESFHQKDAYKYNFRISWKDAIMNALFNNFPEIEDFPGNHISWLNFVCYVDSAEIVDLFYAYAGRWTYNRFPERMKIKKDVV